VPSRKALPEQEADELIIFQFNLRGKPNISIEILEEYSYTWHLWESILNAFEENQNQESIVNVVRSIHTSRPLICIQQGCSLDTLSCEEYSRYEITRSAALHPEDIAFPTDNPPLWLPA